MFSRTLYAQHPVFKNLPISPRFSPTIFYRDANSVLLLAHPVFEIVRDESVKVYLHMFNRNVPSMRRILCHLEISHVSPVLANDF